MDDKTTDNASSEHRCGYVTLAGKPNVGKSTLLNALIGERLSIVSAKAQTTRQRISGILTTDAYQILFIDSPGMLEPRYALQESMAWAAGAALDEADVIVYVADATRSQTLPAGDLPSRLLSRSVPTIVAINKSDLVASESLSRTVQQIEDLGLRATAISALTGQGVQNLLDSIVQHLPVSPALFPAEDTAIENVRFFVEEFVRETCLELFREEIPYSVACRVDEFREHQDPVYVRVVIYVERESQKGIVIGRGGSAIRRVGEISRRKVEELLGLHVFLELRVKVMADWSRKHQRLGQLGYSVPPNARGGQKGR